MKETANIKIQVDKIKLNNFAVRDIITRSLLNGGYELTVRPIMDQEGRVIGEELIIYEIRQVKLDNNDSSRRKY